MIRKLLFIIGFALCSFPLVSGVIQSGKQRELIRTYQEDVHRKEKKEEILQNARYYNNILYQTKGAVFGELENTVLSEENYTEQLKIGDNGLIGSIEIPKIQVSLPIWHGTSEEVLANGAGHLMGTSLPVGGENTRCVLTGHRGLPSSKLFTRLDELTEGDLIYLQVCGETLAYRVNHIEVIDPEEIEKLQIIPQKDIVTLVTCTPYGINTHRFIVDGERIAYRRSERDAILPGMLSIRELCFWLLPFLIIGVVIVEKWKERKRRCKDNEKKSKICISDSVLYSGYFAHGRKRTGRRNR